MTFSLIQICLPHKIGDFGVKYMNNDRNVENNISFLHFFDKNSYYLKCLILIISIIFRHCVDYYLMNEALFLDFSFILMYI